MPSPEAVTKKEGIDEPWLTRTHSQALSEDDTGSPQGESQSSATMAAPKRVLSWLQSSAASNGEPGDAASKKKKNRWSFSGFPHLSPKTTPVSAPSMIEKPAPKHESPAKALARTIYEETDKLERYYSRTQLPELGFGVDSPRDIPALPQSMQSSRQTIMHASKELNLLLMGPRETVRWGAWNFLDTLSLQILNGFGIAKLVPAEGTISLEELAKKTPLDPINLARSLRHAMTMHVFQEPVPGQIAHTAASLALGQDEALQAWVGLNGEEIFPAAGHAIQALQTHPEAISPLRTGFNFAFGTVDKEPIFATFGKDPARAKRMGLAMASLTGGEGYEVSYFVNAYDFSEIDDREGTFVDVGGSHGFVCVDLARKWKRMKFVVQDLPKTIESIAKPICEEDSVSSRISLQAHDFFTTQPAKDADVYYFRWIFHNYSTPFAIKLLKNLIPALKPGARVVINDHCLRTPGSEAPWDEKVMRGMDLVMLALLNAQERTEEEFRGLFASADKNYVFKGVTRPPNCRMSIVEAVWDPEEARKRDAATATADTRGEQAGDSAKVDTNGRG